MHNAAQIVEVHREEVNEVKQGLLPCSSQYTETIKLNYGVLK